MKQTRYSKTISEKYQKRKVYLNTEFTCDAVIAMIIISQHKMLKIFDPNQLIIFAQFMSEKNQYLLKGDKTT